MSQPLLSQFIRIVACCGAVLCSEIASGALIYELDFDQPSYELGQGETQQIRFLFREIHDRSSSDAPKLAIGGQDGLFSPAFVLDFGGIATDSGPGVTLGEFSFNTSLLENSFSTKDLDNSNRLLTVIGQAASLDGIEVTPFQVGNNDVYEFEIGSLFVTNQGGLGDSLTLTMSQPTIAFTNDFADFSGTPTIQFGSASIGSTAVPEPSSLALMAGAGCIMALRRRRRNRKVSAICCKVSDQYVGIVK